MNLHQKGYYAQAVTYYDKVIAVEPGGWKLYFFRGLSKSFGEFPEAAEADFTRALQLNPQSDCSYFNRGIVRYEMGEYTAALADFDQTLEMEPGDAKALYNRGLTHFAMGNYAAASRDAALARKYYQQLHNRPLYREANQLLQAIRHQEEGPG